MSHLTRRTCLGGLSAAGLLATASARAAVGMDGRFDLVIKGGNVVDPSQSLHARRDIGIRAGIVEALEAEIPAGRAKRVVDAAGKLILPRPVDLHAHTRPFGSDAGEDIHAQARLLADGSAPAIGFKLRPWNITSADRSLESLKRAIRAADAARVMVDVGDIENIDAMSRVLDLLRSGDIVTECYSGASAATGRGVGIVANGRVLPAALAAKRRGVLFDTGRGGGSEFAVIEAAIAQGAAPDTISPELYALPGTAQPLPILSSTIAKFLHIGFGPEKLAAMTASVPASIIGGGSALGTLQIGAPAPVSLLTLEDRPVAFVDGGITRIGRGAIRSTLIASDGNAWA